MPKFTALVPNRYQEVPVTIGEETVLINVAMHAITPSLLASMSTKGKKADVRAFTDFLATTIESWDITGEDDKPLPVNAEVLGKLPFSVLTALTEGVMEAITLGNAAASPS